MKSLFGCSGILILLTLQGCVVRTQDFHCVQKNDPEKTFELRMSPTHLDYLGKTYTFKEENATSRLYTNQSLGLEVSFNVSSTNLIRSDEPDKIWSCERYKPF